MTTHVEGTELNNRYILTSHIGDSKTASVWQATDTVLARPVVVKIVDRVYAQSPQFLAAFHAVSKAGARLSHPNIVAIFDTGCDGDDHYVVMECLEGMSLATALERRRAQANPQLAPYECARIGRKVAMALAHVHRSGMVHGSLRPSQIIITADGDVKVTDFGAIRQRSEHAYTAPELILGEPPSMASDLYSLGIILFEALKGTPPPPQSEVAPTLERMVKRGAIPEELAILILSLTFEDPADRPHSADEVALILKPLEHVSVDPEPVLIDIPWYRQVRVLVPVLALTLMIMAVAYQQWGSEQAIAVMPQPTVRTVNAATLRPPVVSTATITGIMSYDPQGDNKERDDLLANMVDQAPATVWHSEPYFTPTFGGLKKGVGVILDLGQSLHIQDILVTTPSGGFSVQIALAMSHHDELAAWALPAETTTVIDGTTTITLPPDQHGRYVLVWITGPLPADGDRFRATISELAVHVLEPGQ